MHCQKLLMGAFVLLSGVVADAAKIELVAGDPNANGTFKFTLRAPDGTEQEFVVNGISRTDNEVQKAIKIQNFVAGVTGWDAVRDGNKLTFRHREEEQWRDVTTIKNLDDTTREADSINAVAAMFGDFDFGLSDAVAAGVDDDGGTSFVTVQTAGGYATVFPEEGETAESIIEMLFQDLESDEVDIVQTSALSFQITHVAFIAFHNTDVGLEVSGAGGTVIDLIPTVSEWGLVVLALLLVAGAKVYFGQRRRVEMRR